MDKLAKAVGYILGTILMLGLIVIVALIVFNVIFGLFSLATWLVTGEWFHIVSSNAGSIF